MWILISIVVVAILALGAAVVFVNALGSVFNIFNAHSHSVHLLRWPDGWWPRKKIERRFPLSYACTKPEYSAETLAQARAARAKALELRPQGKELDAWSSYNDVCKNYEFLLERLEPHA